MSIEGLLSRDYLGMPGYLWGVGLAAVGAWLWQRRRTNQAAPNTYGSQTAGTGTWSSSSTGTGPTGQQYTNQATYSGPAYSPGFVSTGADYLGGYGSGQTSVTNVPTDTDNLNPQIPVTDNQPTSQSIPGSPGMTQGFYYTTPRAMYPQTAAEHAFNLHNDPVSMSIDAIRILLANPQIRMTNDDMIPAGTRLLIPGMPGPPGTYDILGDPHDPDQGKQYIPPPIINIPQQTTVSQVTR